MSDALAAAPLLGIQTVEVSRRPHRPARTAELEIRPDQLDLLLAIATNQQPTKQRGTNRARTRSPVLHL